MMNFDNKKKAEIIINDIFQEIDEPYIYKKINQPIEKAALTFPSNEEACISHQLFNTTIRDFVAHLFNKGCSVNISSKTIALAEAVAIVEMGYQGSSNGYYAAFLDTTHPEICGFEIILQQIKGIIISILRDRHIQWVYDTNITPLRWSTKIIIAEILLDQWRGYFPSNMQTISPVRMADSIPLLINTIQAAEDNVKKSTGNVS